MPEFRFEMESIVLERAYIEAESVEKAWDSIYDSEDIDWEYVSGEGGDITLEEEWHDKAPASKADTTPDRSPKTRTDPSNLQKPQ